MMDKEKELTPAFKQLTLQGFLEKSIVFERSKKSAQLIRFRPKKTKAELAREKAIEKIVRFAERLEG